MNYQEQWYRDEDVKELINQIKKVMKKYNIDKMNFESSVELEKFICSMTGTPTEHTMRTEYYPIMFHLEFQEGRIQIDL